MAAFVVRNSRRLTCEGCGDHHDFFTAKSPDAVCDTPVAFSKERAREIAKDHARGANDIEPAPDNMVVILDSSARQLPHYEGHSQLQQFSLVEQPM